MILGSINNINFLGTQDKMVKFPHVKKGGYLERVPDCDVIIIDNTRRRETKKLTRQEQERISFLREIGIHGAKNLGKSKSTYKKVMKLLTPNYNGTVTLKDKEGNKVRLKRALAVDELNVYTSLEEDNRSAVLDDPRKIRNYIKLMDNYGLNPADAAEIAYFEDVKQKFCKLTHPKYGKFSPEEGVMALDLPESKLEQYDNMLNLGLSPGEARLMLENDEIAARFFRLITPNERGKVELAVKNDMITLPRALNPNEAVIAVTELFAPEKIYEQLIVNGKIKSTAHAY